MVAIRVAEEHEMQDFGGSFSSTSSSLASEPPAKDMCCVKADLETPEKKQQHLHQLQEEDDDAGLVKGSKMEDIGSTPSWWQWLEAYVANPKWTRCMSVALGATVGTLLVLVVVLVVVSRVKAAGSDGGDWLESPTALMSNLTIASPSRTLTSDDCTSAWQVLGKRMVSALPTSVLVSWECSVPSGAALPSTLVLTLSFISSGGSRDDASTQAIHDRVVGTLSSAALSSALVGLNVGCKAELLYQDSLGSTVLAVSEQRDQAILLPGQQAHLTIKTCATSTTPSDSSSSTPSTNTTKPPASSGPATCVAVLTLRNSNNKPIPYHSPRDNCLRMVYAALPYFSAANIRVTPWCTQFGNTTGTVQFYQPLLTPAQYEALATQVKSSTGTASAILSALKISSTCKASLSINALNCVSSSPTYSLDSQNARSVFACSPGSE